MRGHQREDAARFLVLFEAQTAEPGLTATVPAHPGSEHDPTPRQTQGPAQGGLDAVDETAAAADAVAGL